MKPRSRHPARRPASPSRAAPTTVAHIDLAALAHNLEVVRRSVPTGCQIIAVVKADAYGHGAVPIARALASLGVTRFGVATLEEGLALRRARLSGGILVMGALPPGAFGVAVRHRLTPVLHDIEALAALPRALGRRRRPYPVHLKVETGMSRLGLSAHEVSAMLDREDWRRAIAIEGLMTHLADADNADPAYTAQQLERFRQVVEVVAKAGLRVPLIHAANSAGILRHPASHFSAVRPGLMLYGYHTLGPEGAGPPLRPVLSLRTHVVQVRKILPGEAVSYNRQFVASRPSRVAVLPVGYADGYARGLSNRGRVLLQGREAPVVGRVCMDMTMVDVTDVPDVSVGSEAVLIGSQGDRWITASDLASLTGTIPYEVLCAIGPRVRRAYRRAP